MSFKTEGKIKTFSNEQKLRELIARRPLQQEIPKKVFHVEEKLYDRKLDL